MTNSTGATKEADLQMGPTPSGNLPFSQCREGLQSDIEALLNPETMMKSWRNLQGLGMLPSRLSNLRGRGLTVD